MTVIDWITFVLNRSSELWLRTGEHLLLTGVSTGLAIAIAVPLGILASRYGWLRNPLLGIIGILQTIPSLAMLAILLALTGKIGVLPAIIALTLYALLPIARNTLTGLQGLSPEVIEAARGIGMTERQQLWMVRLPLAVPYIIAGIRTAAVVGVGIATLVAFIGAGGLGQFINRGLALSNTPLILLGAIPAAILALIVDFSIAAVQWGMKPIRKSDRGTFVPTLRKLALVQPMALVVLGIFAFFTDPTISSHTGVDDGKETTAIRIGTKRFSEQFIIGEMITQLIEARTDLQVDLLSNLGGTMICHGALTRGEIDMYVEYTGTALTAILKHPTVTDPKKAYDIVAKAYKDRFNVVWLQPFGFNNAYSITVRKADANSNGWNKISDLAGVANNLRAGWTAEFSERPDGYPGLRKAYGFSFGEVVDVDPAIMYQAVAKGELDVVCAYTTDGRIPAYNLKPLQDDKRFFPPYYAAPIIRSETLRKHPVIRNVLSSLTGLLNDAVMQQLNFEVDEKQRTAKEVAHEFLVSKKLLKK